MPLPFSRRASQTAPSFSRDFAGLKTLDHGVGPAITFTRASNATFFDASGTLQTASNDTPRFDHSGGSSLGLLIEESRTNSIRNSQAGGSTNGVIGSGGVRPTFWEGGGPTGTTTEIVGTGTTNGLSWVDIKVSGTNTSGSTGFWLIRFDPANQVAASSGQSWTSSFYAAIVGGSTAGLTQGPAIHVQGTTSPSTFRELTTVPITLTSSLQRFTATRTLTNALTDRVNNQIYAEVADGTAIDITVRIAAPQLEQGAFATSYIPTTSAAATRSADSAVVTPISSFYNQAEGTLFGEASATNAGASLAAVLSLDDTTASNRIQFRRFATNSSVNANVSGLADGAINSWPLGATLKIALAFKVGDIARSIGGGAIAATSSGSALPSGLSRMEIGNGINSNFANGHIRKIAYWPKRLTNTLLQQLTT
jgi:hypothetical protein